MFSIMHKDLKNMFTGQRLLSLLLVLNIIVSCLVICFSYGVYYNYNKLVDSGEAPAELTFSQSEGQLYPESGVYCADVTPQQIMGFVSDLSDITRRAIKDMTIWWLTTSPAVINSDDSEDGVYYSENSKEGVLSFTNTLSVDGEIRWSENYSPTAICSPDEFTSGEKIVYVTKDMFDINAHFTNALPDAQGNWLNAVYNTLQDEEYIKIGGEDYKVMPAPEGSLPDEKNMYITPFAAPENARLYSMGSQVLIQMRFKDNITKQCYDDISKCISAATDNKIAADPIEFTDVSEIEFYRTIMLLSVLISALAAVNMAILYRYILEKRSSQLAIMRICGCTKGKAAASYLCECLVVSLPLFALAELAYSKLLTPLLSKVFVNLQGAYSFKLYAEIFVIYAVSLTVVMLVMICVQVAKHSLAQLRKRTATAKKYGIMNVFEVLQLVVVLSVMVIIVSAISARNEEYAPFKKYIERRGYMAILDDMATYPEDFEALTGSDTEYIRNELTNAFNGDELLLGISYSDKFIKAYTPPMQSGKWLGDSSETYENSGVIPVVMASCGGRYNVGDTFEFEYTMSYDENGEPIDPKPMKYKVVGVLKDKAKIAGYNISPTKNSIEDVYGVFSEEYEQRAFFLSRRTDIDAAFGASGPLYGTQFIFCDDMAEDEYSALAERLFSAGIAYTPLSQVRSNSMQYIYEQMYTLLPIAICIFILTIISTVSISAIYTKRQLRNYAIFYICGARWRTCALRSLKNSAITCGIASILAAAVLIIGKLTFFENMVINFGLWHIAVCALVIILYLALSMIMPLAVIGSNSPQEVLKEE